MSSNPVPATRRRTVPYLCRITISGPEPDTDGVSDMTDALADAIHAGWEAPQIITADDEEDETPHDIGDTPERTVLDYRVLGYPGGAIILVVLDGTDLMEASAAITSLAQHLTTWSPGLLEYAPEEVEISRLNKPYDDENWLPPMGVHDDHPEPPRWHLAELLDDELQDHAAQYLIATAIRSLWNPADTRQGQRAWDIVAGAPEPPWPSQLSEALGLLLIRAARFEADSDSHAPLVVQGAGELDLAADFLRRARRTATESQTDGRSDDEMRGHLLVERFMADHQLQWNRVPADEPADETGERSDRQLRTLLWAGLRALATMAMPLKRLTGPWQILAELGDETLVTILAHHEEHRNEAAAEHDLDEVEAAAAAHVLVWLAIRHPSLLNTRASATLVDAVAQDGEAFHQVIHATLVMTGPSPLRAALQQMPTPARLQSDMEDLAAALAATDNRDTDDTDDPYNDMHAALEEVLQDGPGLAARVRYLLDVTGRAARLADNEPSPHRDADGNGRPEHMITHYLLLEPGMHAATIVDRDDDDATIRTRMLSITAAVAPTAVGALAAEFPELSGDDPRLEPASRTRALSWIQNALRLATPSPPDLTHLDCGPDARALIAGLTAEPGLFDEWPIHRLVSAAAEAAAAILHTAHALDHAYDTYTEN
jgi:hypothetical protein